MRIGGGIIKVFIFFISLFLLTEVLFLISPKIINIQKNKDTISKIFKEQSGESINFNTASFKTYPDFSVKIYADNIEIKDILKTDRFEARIWLPKLIVKKLSVKNLIAENVKLYVVRNQDNTTNIDNFIYNTPFKIDTNKINFNVNNYKLFFADKVVEQNIQFEGEKLFADINKSKLKIDIKGDLRSGKHFSDIDLHIDAPNPNRGFEKTKKYFSVTGYIKNLHPEIFKEYFKLYDKDIYDVKGVINAEFKPEVIRGNIKSEDINISIEGLKILSKIPEKSIIFSNKNIIKSHIHFDKHNLITDSFEFSGDKFKIKTTGKITGWGTKSPKLDLNIDIDEARAEELYWMLPSNLFTEELEILKIKKYGAYGDVKGSLQLKGDILKPDVYGAVDFDNVWVLDGLPPEVPKAIVKTNFKKDKVYVDVKVWATPLEFVKVVGWSDFFDLSKNEYKINSTDNVPLATAQKILVPVSDVLGFIIGPVPIMDIKGYGNIDLYAAGTKEKPFLEGVFRYKNATASFNDINLKLEKAFGGVDFKKDKIYFYTDKGLIWGQPASIKGVSDSKVNIDYKAEVNNVALGSIIHTLKTSPMIENQAKQINLIESADGKADLKLNILGKMNNNEVKKAMQGDIMKYFTPEGVINIKEGHINIKNPSIPLSSVNGAVQFNLEDIKPNITAKIFESPITVNGVIGKKSDMNVSSEKMKLKDSFKLFAVMNLINKNNIQLKDISSYTTFKTDIKYRGDIENFEYDKINLSAVFPSKKNSNSNIDVLSGSFFVNNGNINLKNIHTKFYNTTANVNGSALNVFHKPVVNGDFSIFKLDLKMLDSIKKSGLLPIKYRQILNAYKDYKGTLSADMHVKNNNINGNIWLRDISFVHAILDYPFWIKSADFNFKNSNLEIKSFNASFAGTPIFLNGTVKNIIKAPNPDIYFTSKLSSDFVDNYINTNLSYPLKVTGEILLSSKIKGNPDSINIYPSIKLEEGADISYMGANLGDENSIREFSGDFRYVKDNFIIKNLDYSKYIYSQNNKLYPLPLVNLKGEMKFIQDKIFINNMDVKTFNPINANIFNTIFKKSIIKSGKMTCDINIKGYADKPKILGQMNIKNVQAPSVETSVEEINAYFNPKNIDIITKANYLGSDINILAKIKNNNFDIIHFDNLEIHSSKLNLDRLLHSLNEISYSRPIQILGEISPNSPVPFKPEHLLIDNGKWIIDNIIYKTIPLNNFSGKLSLKNSRLKLDEVLLNIAGGKLKGNFNYDFKKATIYAKTKVEQVDANEMANTFFDIKNQIFGKLDGNVEVTTTGASDEEQKQNLNGVLSFSINQGKMPKLGSLEYLLRAGNLLKSGISGLTINNIKSILIPVQSGEFDTIQGNLNIVDGLAKNIKIYSKGQNLSILIFGDYNIPTSVADIYVLGKLSKNIDSILGPIGNASLNSFFNLIPGVHLDEAKDTDLIKQINSIPELGLPTNKFRIFRVKIDGDLNSEEFVNTFEWLDK